MSVSTLEIRTSTATTGSENVAPPKKKQIVLTAISILQTFLGELKLANDRSTNISTRINFNATSREEADAITYAILYATDNRKPANLREDELNKYSLGNLAKKHNYTYNADNKSASLEFATLPLNKPLAIARVKNALLNLTSIQNAFFSSKATKVLILAGESERKIIGDDSAYFLQARDSIARMYCGHNINSIMAAISQQQLLKKIGAYLGHTDLTFDFKSSKSPWHDNRGVLLFAETELCGTITEDGVRIESSIRDTTYEKLAREAKKNKDAEERRAEREREDKRLLKQAQETALSRTPLPYKIPYSKEKLDNLGNYGFAGKVFYDALDKTAKLLDVRNRETLAKANYTPEELAEQTAIRKIHTELGDILLSRRNIVAFINELISSQAINPDASEFKGEVTIDGKIFAVDEDLKKPETLEKTRAKALGRLVKLLKDEKAIEEVKKLGEASNGFPILLHLVLRPASEFDLSYIESLYAGFKPEGASAADISIRTDMTAKTQASVNEMKYFFEDDLPQAIQAATTQPSSKASQGAVTVHQTASARKP